MGVCTYQDRASFQTMFLGYNLVNNPFSFVVKFYSIVLGKLFENIVQYFSLYRSCWHDMIQDKDHFFSIKNVVYANPLELFNCHGSSDIMGYHKINVYRNIVISVNLTFACRNCQISFYLVHFTSPPFDQSTRTIPNRFATIKASSRDGLAFLRTSLAPPLFRASTIDLCSVAEIVSFASEAHPPLLFQPLSFYLGLFA